MPIIKVKEHEPFEVAMRRFKRTMDRAGIVNEVRERQAYEKPTWVRKRKAAAAVKRLNRRLATETLPKKMY